MTVAIAISMFLSKNVKIPSVPTPDWSSSKTFWNICTLPLMTYENGPCIQTISYRVTMLSWSINFMQWYFICHFPGNFFDYNNILITMEKDIILNLRIVKTARAATIGKNIWDKQKFSSEIANYGRSSIAIFHAFLSSIDKRERVRVED